MKTILESSHREYRTFVANRSGLQTILPVIVTEQGVLDEYARFIHLNRLKSRSWQDSMTFSIQLLIEYIDANHACFTNPTELFRDFSNSLYAGTIEENRDPSDLWWEPRRPADVRQIISNITYFSDWLAKINENRSVQLNPWRDATRHEQRLNWAAYAHRRDNAFLSHLWRSDQNIKKTRSVRVLSNPTKRNTQTKAFQEENFGSLMTEGFRRRERDELGSTKLRDILITYLMHYGGLRLSEALGLWSEDVTVENGEVVVRLYHPQYGVGSDGQMRAVTLLSRYGLKPRNTLVKATDALFLGWKNGLITDPQRQCFEVFFYPYEKALEFATIWRDYHFRQRIKPTAGAAHPYAFTNYNGDPYSHRMFRKAHRLAIDRIGLPYGKMNGTTPHSHRHSYGQRLAKNGASPLIIKSAMHHASILSSETYTQPTGHDMLEELKKLETRLTLNFKID